MRIIIYTGKGGVGKTSVAAATGVKLASMGVKTLVISTDMAHSLSDSFNFDLGYKTTKIRENLFGLELNPQTQLEENWDSIYNYMVDFFKVMGLRDVFAEELSMFPGIEELFSLIEIHDQYIIGDYQALVLDFPPTAASIRLLSLFDVVGWYMERFFNLKRRSVKVLKTFTDTFMEMPLPEDDVFTAFAEIYHKIEETKHILSDSKKTSVRLIMNPEEMVVNESQRAYTYLNLYGFNVDTVIVNKLLPRNSREEFYNKIVTRQQRVLGDIENIFSSLPVFKLPQLSDELKGITSLEVIANKLYKNKNPLDVFYHKKTVKLERKDNSYLFKIFMPFIKKDKFNIYQKGGMLILKVGSYKQKIYLPQILSNKAVKKASYNNDYIQLIFK